MRRLGYAVFLAFGILFACLSPALAQDSPSRTSVAIAHEYWVFDSGKQIGPLAFQQVLDRIATGESNLGTQVWTSHFNAWVNIDTMPEFTSALATAPTQYWVFDNNAQFGPLRLDEVVARIARGESNQGTQVWTAKLNAWVMIDTVPELAEALEGRPPAIAGGAPYYLYEFEEQKGPFSKADLIKQIERGDIGKSGFVWTPGMADWVAIETIREFAEAFAPEIELEKPYYVIADGARLGPLTDSEIRIRILDGLSTAEDLAWKKGLADWTPLSEFGELADALAAVEGPPPLPGEDDGPPPLPGDDDDKIAVITPPGDDDETAMPGFTELMTLLESRIADFVPTAPLRARDEAIDCLADEFGALDAADWQVFIDSGLSPSEAQVATIERKHPGFEATTMACIDRAESMNDTLDALLWTMASDTAGNGQDEAALKGYACLREAVDPMSEEDRSAVAAEGAELSDATAKRIESAYPGITAAVRACEGVIKTALAGALDGGVVDKPEVVIQPKVDDRPPVIIAPKIGITDGPEVIEDKQATVTKPQVIEQPAGSVDERLRAVILDLYERQAADLPEAVRIGLVNCTAGKYGVLTNAEKELVIASKFFLSRTEMEALEAAHPGLTKSLEDCIPKF